MTKGAFQMNKIFSIISAAVCTASLTAGPFSVSAADGEKVYGTMNIPYADFYKAEIARALRRRGHELSV